MGSQTSKLTSQGKINYHYWQMIRTANVGQMFNCLVNMCHQPEPHPQNIWDLPLIYQLIIYCTRFKKEDLMLICHHYEDYFKSQIHTQLDSCIRLHFVADNNGRPTCGKFSEKSNKGCEKGITYSLHGCRPIKLLGLMKSNLALFNQRSHQSKYQMTDIYDYLEKYLIDLGHKVPQPLQD